MKPGNTDINLQFLSGGGEMGKLMRDKDWSTTPVGAPGTWPPALCTSLSILLNSKFPMFLWWGKELICFYNDAYRPSLGENGKHPVILGQTAKEAWPEIWDIIKPLIDQVLAGGEATWSENQLIPIFRNGHIEDVYWTFSYSPVKDENGKIEGVLVVCNETTETVTAFKSLEASNNRYFNNIMQAPIAMCVFKGKNHVVEIANELMLGLWGKSAEQVMNKPIFEGLPEAKGQGLEQLMDNVLITGEKFVANERLVNLPRNGKLEGAYINFVYEPFKDADGTVSGMVAIAYDVTLQVIARKKVENSEQDLRNLVLEAPIGICVLDAKTLVSEIVNESFIEVAGKPYEAIVGKFYWDTFAEARPYYESALTRVVEQGVPYYANEVELMLIRHGKEEIIYVTFVYAPLKNAEDKVEKVAIWVLENTHQVIARKKIVEAEERLRLATEAGGIATFDLDIETREIIYSDSLSEIFGLDKYDKYTQQELRNSFHPDDREIVKRSFDESIETGILKYEARIIKRNGSVAWVRTEGKAHYNEEKKPVKLIGTIRDITEERHRRQELLDSENRLNIVIDASDLGTWELNLKTDEMNYSNRYLEIMGYGHGSVAPHSEVVKQLHPDDVPIRKKAFGKALIQGYIHYEARIIWKDGSVHWIEAKGKTFYDDKQDPIMMIGTLRDITEEKSFAGELERQVRERTRELAKKNIELEKMNVELQSFAYVSSHDLQEPLRKIQTFASRLLEKEVGNLSETGKDYFSRMQKAANRMQTLIEDLLTYSRTNTTERVFKKTNLNDILAEVKNDLRDILAETRATIDADIMCSVNIIPFQFSQLIHNLIGNSIKFSKPGERPHIKLKSEIIMGSGIDSLSLSPQKKYCHITISDNGIGFDPQYKDRIFEVFQRLHGKEKYSGTGIGLAIVKKIVENHNGVITATARPDKGATFDIYIPET